jgi:hypothetical protein
MWITEISKTEAVPKVAREVFTFVVLGFELRAYTLSHSTSAPSLFCDGFFRDKFSQTICPGWLQTVILLISAS